MRLELFDRLSFISQNDVQEVVYFAEVVVNPHGIDKPNLVVVSWQDANGLPTSVLYTEESFEQMFNTSKSEIKKFYSNSEF